MLLLLYRHLWMGIEMCWFVEEEKHVLGLVRVFQGPQEGPHINLLYLDAGNRH